jgi:hypothetical protein
MITSMPTDPLMNLPPDRIPEPSRTRMNETIAAAQQLFTTKPATTDIRRGGGRRRFFAGSWMEAILGAGLVTAAGIMAFSLSPAFLGTVPPEQEPLPAEAFRTDMRQTPPMRPLGLDLIVPLEPATFGELRLGVRNVDDRFGVYRVDDKGLEQTLLSGNKAADEAVSVTDAVLVDRNGRRVLAVRSGFGDLQRWDAFVDDEFGFTISPGLSRIIWDAADARDIEDRLAATAPAQ